MPKQVKSTPGPWIVPLFTNDGRDISIEAHTRLGNPQYIGRVYNAGILAKSSPESEANARLIAAAPAMLAFVQEVFSNLDELKPAFRDKYAFEHLYRESQRIIAQAEGHEGRG